MTETFDVVTLGEALGGFVAREIGPLELAATFERHIVGAEFNTAVGVCRLGRSASFIGRVGADGLGRSVLRALRQESVDHRYLTVDEAAPTGVLIRTRRGGVASEVVYHRAGSAGSSLAPEHVDAAREAITGARWLHVTGVTPALSASCCAAFELAIAIAHEAGTQIALDLNLRRKLWDEIGGLDESFKVGTFEDDDFSMRVREAGYRIVTAEDCFIHHFGNGSFGKLQSEVSLRIFDQNKKRFESKWNVAWRPHQTRPGVRPISADSRIAVSEFLGEHEGAEGAGEP